MYNRYIPQSDGTYRRSRMQDSMPRPQSQAPMPAPAPSVTDEPVFNPSPQQEPQPRRPMPASRPRPSHPPRREQGSDSSILGFLRQLLPKDFDTGDLLVVLLLLLMSGDCAEDQNTALLTLVLYLFL